MGGSDHICGFPWNLKGFRTNIAKKRVDRMSSGRPICRPIIRSSQLRKRVDDVKRWKIENNLWWRNKSQQRREPDLHYGTFYARVPKAIVPVMFCLFEVITYFITPSHIQYYCPMKKERRQEKSKRRRRVNEERELVASHILTLTIAS